MSDEVILYELASANKTRFSPFCWRTRWGLRHKELSFKSVQIGFPDIAELGGARRTVPVIRIGDTFVEDSWDIAEYLDRAYPDRPPLLGCALGRRGPLRGVFHRQGDPSDDAAAGLSGRIRPDGSL